MRLLDKLISNLRTTPEDSQTLIDRTMVLYGSNMDSRGDVVPWTPLQEQFKLLLWFGEPLVEPRGIGLHPDGFTIR